MVKDNEKQKIHKITLTVENEGLKKGGTRAKLERRSKLQKIMRQKGKLPEPRATHPRYPR